MNLWRSRKFGVFLVEEEELKRLVKTKAVRIRVWEINKRRPEAILETRLKHLNNVKVFMLRNATERQKALISKGFHF